MPAGDRQRTWFPEMVEALRAEWRAEMSWDDVIALRDRLDRMLQQIRHTRHITLARTSTVCSCCGGPMVQGSASVSVRAAILALGRFRIAPPAEVKLWRDAGTSTERRPAAIFMGTNILLVS